MSSKTYEVNGVVIVSKPPRPPVMSRRNRRNVGATTEDASSTTNDADMNDQSSFSNEVVPPSRRSRSPGIPASQNKKLQRGAHSNDSEFHYVYHDHTADIQIHGWGDTLEQAFASVGVGMFGYMFELHSVMVDPSCTETLTVSAPDVEKLCFMYLDELLGKFTLDQIVICKVKVHSVTYDESLDEPRRWSINFTIQGESFCSNHVVGTEVKAITYSNLVVKTRDSARLAISGNNKTETEDASSANPIIADSQAHGADIFVIVDI